ncbi:hypothetical protein SBRCBS47491_010198, partial [Sporothrix bragantina]
MVAGPNAYFRGQQAELVRFHQLDRIVYDECHVILESRASFRPAIQLTATLPPADKADFFRRINTLQATATVIREPTKRSTITYVVHTLNNIDDRTATLQKILRQARTDRRRAIVFYPAVAMAVELAKILQAPVFHANNGPSVDEKEAIVRAWANDDTYGPIVAT